ncbi:MAG: sulfotransferase family protein [Candidatus Thiodiazotropha sp. (ex Myrtea spinifera)]|nr:sulfotransferase family protein [Candidatus Thiodiazotropha sp. (ex Myrtea spinifera)]
MLLAIHIPKTGGTKLQNLLTQVFREKIYLDYGTERDLKAARTCDPLILNDRASFQSKNKCIYGHYHYLKYKGLFDSEKVVFVMRDPVDRVISQYRHIALHGEREVERHKLIMDGDMDVVHFSKFKFIGNAQSIYLEGLDLSDKSKYFPIFAHEFKNSVIRLIEWLGEDMKKYTEFVDEADKKVNSRHGMSLPKCVIPIRAEDRESIRKNCSEDMRLYEFMLSLTES